MVSGADRSFKVFGDSLSIVIALIFGSAGTLKFFPLVSPEINKMFVAEFIKYAKIHPAVSYGYVIDANKFMELVAVVEIVCSLLILTAPRILKLLSCLVFTSIIIGALYFLYALNEPFLYLFLNSMLLLVLFIRLHLFYFPDNRVQNEIESVTKKEN